MTKTALPDTESPGHDTCWRGADLLQVALAALGRIGYRKVAVDTWRHDHASHNIRHSYAGGRWELACWYDREPIQTIGWPDNTSAIRVERLLHGQLPTSLMSVDWHLGDLTPVR